jgi:acetylornithine deacetylase/succinyl-diaminopimelate desuccinylase-like protein
MNSTHPAAFCALLALACVHAHAAGKATEHQRAADEHYKKHYRAILDEYESLVAIPNHAADRAAIERNVAALERMLAKRGFTMRRLEAPGASPAVYGELARKPRRPTVVFYAHYDGQPAGAASDWKTSPFVPTLDRGGVRQPLRAALDELTAVPDDDWRVYARSAADDKAPIIAMLAALDSLAARKVTPAVNLKVFLDGEEEVGSPHLADIVRDNAQLLGADLLLFADGPRHQSGRPQVALGVRGVQGAHLTLFGPARALHSGHYGNWAVNPAARLANLLASMRGPDGRVKIAGFYDAVDQTLADRGVNPDEAVETRLLKELRLSARESPDQPLARTVAWPSLNIVGLRSGDTGDAARNAIPTEAIASLDFRLVPKLTRERVRDLLHAHLKAQGYRVVESRADAEAAVDRERVALVQWEQSGYAGARFTEDAPPVRALIDLLREVHGNELVVAPILGGSLPLSLFAENSPVTAVVVLPIANYDNNQHAPNENLTLGSLRQGIGTFAAIFGALEIPRR